jgi:hypothetical protein
MQATYESRIYVAQAALWSSRRWARPRSKHGGSFVSLKAVLGISRRRMKGVMSGKCIV